MPVIGMIAVTVAGLAAAYWLQSRTLTDGQTPPSGAPGATILDQSNLERASLIIGILGGAAFLYTQFKGKE